MKKIIAVFAALAICSSSVFALPISVALNNPIQTKTGSPNDFTASAFAENGLFADVQPTPLTEEDS